MLRIPLQGNGGMELVCLDILQDDLPQDINKLVFLLQRERIPIGQWFKIAVSDIMKLPSCIVDVSQSRLEIEFCIDTHCRLGR
jgi:hypothetical protein